MPGFVPLTGAPPKMTRQSSGSVVLFEEDVSDPRRLVEVLTTLANRIKALEEIRPQEYIEFEKACGSSGTVTVQHNFNCPVRFYITSWKGSAAPALALNESQSTLNTLVLNSFVAGTAVIRVEKAQIGVTRG
jgi:hypothetical protein